MTIYLDTSVLLRWIFNEKGSIRNPSRFKHIISSELIQVECLRVLDRLRIKKSLEDKSMATISKALYKILERIDLILLSGFVLQRSSQSFPTIVGTLDALHLASAQLWSQSRRKDLLMLTHDQQMARAAQSIGMEVEGV